MSNDQALGAEMRILEDMGLEPDLASVPTPSLAQVATTLGPRGSEWRR